MSRHWAAAILLAVAAAGTPTADADAVVAAGSFSDWTLLTDDTDPQSFCFVTAEPKSSVPQSESRDGPRLYISAWPKDGIKAEFSVRLGHTSTPSREITVAVDPATFRLFTRNDRAFVRDATQELKLVDAMKKGSRLTVQSMLPAGVLVTDTYSLSGLAQALQEMQQRCF